MRTLLEVMSEAMRDLGDWNPQESAEYVEWRLRVAGYRVIGPDEVDQVTVEKCAKIALSYVNQTDYDLEPEAAVAENVTAKMIAAAIHSIGRKA